VRSTRVFRAALLLLTTIVATLALVALAPSASAHAVLQSTSPAADSVLRDAPDTVLLTFGESVTVASNGIRVYDDHLHRVDVGKAGHPTGQDRTVGVSVQPTLGDGTYTVTWRVTSADTHVVAGGFTFSVGAPSRVVDKVPGLSPNHAAAALLGVSRAIGYAGLVAGPGLLVAILVVWPAGLVQRRQIRLIRIGGLLIVVTGSLELLLQSVYTQDLPLSHVFSGAAVAGTHGSRFASTHLIRLYLALPYFVLLAGRWREILRRPTFDNKARLLAGIVAAALGVALLLTWSDSAHASVGHRAWLAVSMDAAHLAAMAVWLGGLLALAVSADALVDDATSTLATFSRLATGCVVLIVGTGVYASWRELGTPAALVHTQYGWLLVAKVLVVVILLGIATRSRSWVHRRLAGATPSIARLRQSLFGELSIGVAVLAVTAALTGTAQGRSTYAPSYTSVQRVANHVVELHIDRAHTGTSTIRITVRGAPVQVVTGSVSLPGQHVGPLPLRFTRVSASSEAAVAIFAVPGHWFVDVLVTFDPLDATGLRFPVRVR
jgi:copper transport protein